MYEHQYAELPTTILKPFLTLEPLVTVVHAFLHLV